MAAYRRALSVTDRLQLAACRPTSFSVPAIEREHLGTVGIRQVTDPNPPVAPVWFT